MEDREDRHLTTAMPTLGTVSVEVRAADPPIAGGASPGAALRPRPSGDSKQPLSIGQQALLDPLTAFELQFVPVTISADDVGFLSTTTGTVAALPVHVPALPSVRRSSLGSVRSSEPDSPMTSAMTRLSEARSGIGMMLTPAATIRSSQGVGVAPGVKPPMPGAGTIFTSTDDGVNVSSLTFGQAAIAPVAMRLDTLRQQSQIEVENVQKRLMMLTLVLCFGGPVVLLLCTDAVIITPPFVVGVLLLTTVGDMNIDRLIIMNSRFGLVAMCILVFATAVSFCSYDYDSHDIVLVGELWPCLATTIFMAMHSQTITQQHPASQYTADSTPGGEDIRRTSGDVRAALPLFSQLLTLYVICMIFAAGSASFHMRSDLYSKWLTLSAWYVGGLAALFIAGKRASRNRGSTRTLFIVLCIYIVSLGCAAITAGVFPQDSCDNWKYRPPRNCVNKGDFESQVVFVVCGSLYIVLVPAVYYARRHVFGVLTWFLRRENRTKTGQALSALFASPDTDVTDLAAAGAKCFRSFRMSDVKLNHEMLMDSTTSAEAFACSRPAKLNTVDYFVVTCCDRCNSEAVESALLHKATAFANEYGREPTFWIDSVCRDRSNSDTLDPLTHLPVFVAGCKKTLVILGDGFFQNLGCAIKLYMAMALHSAPSLIEIIALDDHNDPSSRELQKTIARFDVTQTTWIHAAEEMQFRAAIIKSGGRHKFNNALKQFEQYIEHEIAKRSGQVRKHVAYTFDDELAEERIRMIAAKRASVTSSTSLEPEGGHQDDPGLVKPRRPTELKRHSVILLDELGAGEYGLVRKGLYSSGVVPEFEVAVKMLMPMPTAEDRRQLLREAALTGQFQHPNVISLIGVVTVGDPIMMVLQYCAQGSLKGLLERIEGADGSKDAGGLSQHSNADSLDSPALNMRLASFCAGITNGMEYLASRLFVHRDLASRNILIDAADKVKVADFGLSRAMERKSATYYRAINEADKLPVRWASPEVLKERKFSERSDVWAFGVTACEIFDLGATPHGTWSVKFLVERVKDGYVPPRPERCPAEFYADVVAPCFAFDPAERPQFADLRQRCLAIKTMQLNLSLKALDADPTEGNDHIKRYLSTANLTAEKMLASAPDGAGGGRHSPLMWLVPEGVTLTSSEKVLMRTMSEESLISLFRHAKKRGDDAFDDDDLGSENDENDDAGADKPDGNSDGPARLQRSVSPLPDSPASTSSSVSPCSSIPEPTPGGRQSPAHAGSQRRKTITVDHRPSGQDQSALRHSWSPAPGDFTPIAAEAKGAPLQPPAASFVPVESPRILSGEGDKGVQQQPSFAGPRPGPSYVFSVESPLI